MLAIGSGHFEGSNDPSKSQFYAGGLAPCLSSAIASLIELYTAHDPPLKSYATAVITKAFFFAKRSRSLQLCEKMPATFGNMAEVPLENSRVKLNEYEDHEKRGLVKPGEDPLEVAAKQLTHDQITILHTIGGDDTNTMAAKLAAYLGENDCNLTVVGLPKTDNDVFPISQTLSER